MNKQLKVACIGAGSAGTGHMVRMEKYLPGSCVAFADIDRSKFGKIVAGYLGEGNMALAGDLKSEPFALAPNQGNITRNPSFIDRGNNNYCLSNNSPCVNAGTNQSWMEDSVDLDGRIRRRYGTVDMGTYEFLRSGTIYGFH